MTAFSYRDGALYAEDVPLAQIAQDFGTPTFVYSRRALEEAYREVADAFRTLPHLICYAVKANSNLAVLNLFARQGSGFDIVSGGELARVLAAGGDPAKVVFSGVGKSEAEMAYALDTGILCFNVESAPELETLARVAARMGKVAPISFRVNPDVDPKTHPYISTGLKESKFGVPFTSAFALYRHASGLANIAVRGIDMHIGSQITGLAPYHAAAARILDLVTTLAADGIALEHIDLGGGLGIRYRDEETIDICEYAWEIARLFNGRRETLLLEPGRRLVGNAGTLLTRVNLVKPAAVGAAHSFVVVDAAMNDLIRPALYDAWHDVLPVQQHLDREHLRQRYEIVGPICESGDFLAHDRALVVDAGDLLAVMSAGAYAMTMSSNYNSRPRAAEVMVDGRTIHLARRRETIDQLFANETVLP